MRQELASLQSARETVEAILKMKHDVQRQVITLLYLWWSERCGVRGGEQQWDSGRLAHLTSTYAAEWSSFKPVKELGSQAQVKKSWRPPPANTVKSTVTGLSQKTRDLVDGGMGLPDS